MWLQKIVLICLLSSVYCDVKKILSDMYITLDETCITEKSIAFNDTELIEAFGQCRTTVRVGVFEEAFQHEFQDICQKDKVKFCHDIALDKFGVCLSDSQRNHLNYDKEVQKGIVDILCKDNGKLAKKFASLDNPPCPYNEKDLQGCMNMMSISFDELYTENGCEKLEAMHQCMVTRYKNCEDKEISKFFVDQGRCELRATPCRQYMHDDELYKIFNDKKIQIDKKCVDDNTDEINFKNMADGFKGCTSEVRINDFRDWRNRFCWNGNLKWCQDIILDKFAACLNSDQSTQLRNDTSDQKEIVKSLCENDSVLAQHISEFFWEMRNAHVDEICMNSITDAIDFRGLLRDLQGCKVSLDKFIEIHCSTKDGKLCQDITLEHFEICLNDSQKIYFQYKRNEQITMRDVICDAGEKFANDYKNDSFSDCPMERRLKKCRNMKLDSLEAIASDNCRMQKEGLQCAANMYKNCTNKGMYDVLTEFNRRLFKLPPCGDVGVRSCSLNSVLFIAMLLCLKYFVF